MPSDESTSPSLKKRGGLAGGTSKPLCHRVPRSATTVLPQFNASVGEVVLPS